MLPHAEAFNVDADHDAVYAKADEFVPALVRACLSAVDRATK
jgi:hypothetical protein